MNFDKDQNLQKFQIIIYNYIYINFLGTKKRDREEIKLIPKHFIVVNSLKISIFVC